MAAAMLIPTTAEAQLGGLGRLRDRVRERAEERIEERADREVDQRVDRVVDEAVDEAVDRAVDEFTGMLSDAFTSNKTTVDEENGVIRSEVEGDISLVANETSPARSDFLSYLTVTKYNIRGTVGATLGNGSYKRVYLHDDKMLEKELESGTLMDASSGSMTVLDYENGTYWTHSFAEFGDMMASMRRMQSDAMESAPEGMPDAGPEAEVTLDVREGRRGVIRGSDSQQHFIVVETGPKGGQMPEGETPRAGGLNGKIFMVSEVWTTDDFAGRDTYRDFSERLVSAMGGALSPPASSQSLTSGMLPDPRVDAAMERAAEEMRSMQGLAVQTTNYLVSVPEGQELDLDLVLEDEEFDMNQWGASMSSEPVEGYEKKQVTMMTWETFISNLSAEPFPPELLGVGDLEEVASPLEQIGGLGGG
jgi:hypothetical protein